MTEHSTPSSRLPTSVLNNNIIAEFEQAAKRNNYSMQVAVARGIVKPEIDCLCDPVRPRGPYVDLVSRRICIQESYLAFLWAMVYSTFVLYEEGVQRPMIEGRFTGLLIYDSDLLIRARALGDWAERFAGQYETWNEGQLPNPRVHDNSQERFYAEKTNAIFVRAVTYLLFHEFGHLCECHYDTGTNSAEQIEQEKQADNFALSFLIDSSTTDKERQISGAALVMLNTSSLFLCAEARQIWMRRHPHAHDRIRHCISGLNLTDQKAKDYIYYLASLRIRQFLERSGISCDVLIEDTAEDLFFQYLEVCDRVPA